MLINDRSGIILMPPNIEFKVVMIGAVAVGKTAIANRLQFQVFESDYEPTIGAGYIPYRTTYKGKDVELQIWDTAGMERDKSLGAIYYRDAQAAVIVYDQTNPESADALESWLESFRATVKTQCYIAIAANKDDLPNKMVPIDKIRSWASEQGFYFFVTSAKSGTGVTEMFEALIEGLMKDKSFETRTSPKLRKTNTNGKKGCCD